MDKPNYVFRGAKLRTGTAGGEYAHGEWSDDGAAVALTIHPVVEFKGPIKWETLTWEELAELPIDVAELRVFRSNHGVREAVAEHTVEGSIEGWHKTAWAWTDYFRNGFLKAEA